MLLQACLRSGTSMMMQMLEAGGLDLVVDQKRIPDEDNPRGYLEYEKVKNLRNDISWLINIKGKVIKIISLLLYHLPPIHGYKTIFMQRNIQEVLASQRKMLERSGKDAQMVEDSIMSVKFEAHIKKVSLWIQKQPNIDSLYVSYNEIIQEPLSKSLEVSKFLDKNLDVHAMAQSVDGSLYINKQQNLKR